jgi:hypothetical protein
VIEERKEKEMGTKNNPGEYDCYAKAAMDEPLFTMRAKDVSAPYFVEMWTFIRKGRWDSARMVLEQMINDDRIRVLVGDCDKFDEALAIAEAMRQWKEEHPPTPESFLEH